MSPPVRAAVAVAAVSALVVVVALSGVAVVVPVRGVRERIPVIVPMVAVGSTMVATRARAALAVSARAAASGVSGAAVVA